METNGGNQDLMGIYHVGVQVHGFEYCSFIADLMLSWLYGIIWGSIIGEI